MSSLLEASVKWTGHDVIRSPNGLIAVSFISFLLLAAKDVSVAARQMTRTGVRVA